MADRPVVTLFELYGAGARQVGEDVARALGVPFYPQAFSSEDIEGGDADLKCNAILATVYSVMGVPTAVSRAATSRPLSGRSTTS